MLFASSPDRNTVGQLCGQPISACALLALVLLLVCSLLASSFLRAVSQSLRRHNIHYTRMGLKSLYVGVGIALCMCHVVNARKNESVPTPIVMWHGMGDACCLPFSLGPFKTFLESAIPGVYVVSLEIGSSVVEDLENGYFMSPNKQVQLVCDQLRADPMLKNGFHAIGFSQGSQFLRAVVQRCGHTLPPVGNLVTLGGQHQGVYGLPNCGALTHETCNLLRKLLNHAAYYGWMQRWLVQATYWHDPLDESKYRQKSAFLADINNELAVNATYVENLKRLQHFVMVMFENDTIVQPKETEWFGYYVPGQATEVQSLQQSRIYAEERLGLRSMDEARQLVFLSTPGNHLHFSEEWFTENVIQPYLK